MTRRPLRRRSLVDRRRRWRRAPSQRLADAAGCPSRERDRTRRRVRPVASAPRHLVGARSATMPAIDRISVLRHRRRSTWKSHDSRGPSRCLRANRVRRRTHPGPPRHRADRDRSEPPALSSPPNLARVRQRPPYPTTGRCRRPAANGVWLPSAHEVVAARSGRRGGGRPDSKPPRADRDTAPAVREGATQRGGPDRSVDTVPLMAERRATELEGTWLLPMTESRGWPSDCPRS